MKRITQFPTWRVGTLDPEAMCLVAWLDALPNPGAIGTGEMGRRLGWSKYRINRALDHAEAAGIVTVHGRGERADDGQRQQIVVDVHRSVWVNGAQS